MKTFAQKNSPFMDFEIWPKFSLEPLLKALLVLFQDPFPASPLGDSFMPKL